MAFDGGTGTALDPYLISTPAQLNDVHNYLSSYFLQMADIDLTGITWTSIASNVTFWGGYDGNNFSITNLVINEPATTGFTGLFSYIEGAAAYLKNIRIVDCDVTGKDQVGALCGQFAGGLIEDCHASGSVKGQERVGGLLGNVSSYAGIGTVRRSSSTCSVSTIVAAASSWTFGGFVALTGSFIYEQCFSTGPVYGDSSVGGFVGYCQGNTRPIFRDCYTTSSVNNVFDTEDGYGTVGAFVGYSEDGHFINCYASGTVVSDSMSGTNNVEIGGFYAFAVGVVAADPINRSTLLDNCFYDATKAPPFAYDVDYPYDEGANPTDTAAMKLQETFTGWDFATVWTLDPAYNDGYPTLIHQLPVTLYHNATHYLKQHGQWVEVTEPKAYTTTDLAGFDAAVVTLVDTALDSLLGASY